MDVDAQTMETRPRPNGIIAMSRHFENILVVQTAFIGDAILTLPLIQTLKSNFPSSSIDVVVVPRTAEIFANHPAITRIIEFDKRKKDKGLGGLLNLRARLQNVAYDLVLVPHRSLRSALLAKMTGSRQSIGFDRSAGRFLFKTVVPYDSTAHEIERNLSLLKAVGIESPATSLPQLYPSIADRQFVDSVVSGFDIGTMRGFIAVAPGTVWNTKRWPKERFAEICRQLVFERYAVILLGGREDVALCEEIITVASAERIFTAAGKLSLLQSAELIRRSRLIIANDSAPVHIATAVGTPVEAIFGATVPEFGFAPRGPHDAIVETKGLSCRPCSIHGGKECPIGTFDCMMSISPERVLKAAFSILAKTEFADRRPE
jgi:heptosyltransferase-2